MNAAPNTDTSATPLPVVLMYGLCPWDYIQNRPQQLARALSEYTHVLYIEPPVYAGDLFPNLWSIAGHVLSPVVEPRKVGPSITVLRTRYRYPFPMKSRAIDRLNRALFGRAIRSAVRQFDKPPVLWLMHPAGAEILDHVESSAVVYDLVDRHLDFTAQTAARLREVAIGEARLFREADAVTATAHSLARFAVESGARRVELLPNACDPGYFRAAVKPVDHTDALTIVFVGAIGEWFDFEAIRSLGTALPRARILIAGPLHSPEDTIPDDLPANVRFVGRVEFSELPAFLADANLTLIPFKVNKLTESVNPVKLFEYLAAGKSVLSTPLPEVAAYASVVTISDATGFGEAAKRALETDSPAAAAERLAVADQNSWKQRASDAVALIRDIVGART